MTNRRIRIWSQLLVDDETSKSLTVSFLCAFCSSNSANLGSNDTFVFLNQKYICEKWKRLFYTYFGEINLFKLPKIPLHLCTVGSVKICVKTKFYRVWKITCKYVPVSLILKSLWKMCFQILFNISKTIMAVRKVREVFVAGHLRNINHLQFWKINLGLVTIVSVKNDLNRKFLQKCSFF